MMKISTVIFLMIWTTIAMAADLEITQPIIKLVPPASKHTAGFLKIKNYSQKDLKLLRAESKVSDVVELHNMLMENEMMVMRPVKFILVPKKGEVVLKSGGLHVMFLGLKKPLVKGETVEAKLVFSEGKSETIQFVVND